MTARVRPSLRFAVPRGRWATEPPEHRGVRRDSVRLLVARPGRNDHVRFADLARFLDPGDLLVVNTSATRPGAIDGLSAHGPVVVHLAVAYDDVHWTVELRRPDGAGPVLDGVPGDIVALDGGGRLRLGMPQAAGPAGQGVRLWHATLAVEGGVSDHLAAHGRPITYGRTRRLPLEDHQTVFARHLGSAEMASAARPFSHRVVTELVSRGIVIAPITLHAGVSSQEAGEPPQPEWFHVPMATATQVELARRTGHRVIAVGTTVTRALESAVEGDLVVDRRGWTDLVITPERGVSVVDGLVTGWHEPDASHLLLLEAVAGPQLVERAYAAAVEGPYLWHEFGDSCLLLPQPRP